MPREYIDLISSGEEDEGVARAPIIDLTSDDDEVSHNMSYRSDYALHRNLAESVLINSPAAILLSAREGSPDMCVGCSTLNAQIAENSERPTAVKYWLCTGELSEEDWEHKINNSKEVRSVESCVGEMRQTCGAKKRTQHKAQLWPIPAYRRGFAETGRR